MNQEMEELDRQLQIKSTGAHAHTSGKARYYIKKFSDDLAADPDHFKDGSLDRFIGLVRGAVYRGEWGALSDRMARWW